MTPLLLAFFSLTASPDVSAPPRETRVRQLAIVVGHNRGGDRQPLLRYAEDDARRVADLLRELGGFHPDDVRVLAGPTRAELSDAFATVTAALRATGGPSRVFFYFSGHARANAIALGDESLSLPDLRTLLERLPATLTVAVLDACQSGAFSRVKGAEAAEDFSFNTVSRLGAEGLAVMASSTGNELSQESETLRGSFFTHNLLVALRGAGDADGDGRVTLSEAYHYAYGSTVIATVPTAIGGQHPTLEMSLKGRGEVPTHLPGKIRRPPAAAGRSRGGSFSPPRRRRHGRAAQGERGKNFPRAPAGGLCGHRA